LNAKNDIDVQVESLKTELDNMRERLWKRLEKSEELLIKHFKLDGSNTFTIDEPVENYNIKNCNKLIQKMQISINRLHELKDIKYKVNCFSFISKKMFHVSFSGKI
jgi:hypothetical protein